MTNAGYQELVEMIEEDFNEKLEELHEERRTALIKAWAEHEKMKDYSREFENIQITILQ